MRGFNFTREVQPVLDELREISGQTRADALAGIPAAQREQFIDNLLIIKANLAALEVSEPLEAGLSALMIPTLDAPKCPTARATIAAIVVRVTAANVRMGPALMALTRMPCAPNS